MRPGGVTVNPSVAAALLRREEPSVEPEGDGVRERRPGYEGERQRVEDEEDAPLGADVESGGDDDAVVLGIAIRALDHARLLDVEPSPPPLGRRRPVEVDLDEAVRPLAIRRLRIGVAVGPRPNTPGDRGEGETTIVTPGPVGYGAGRGVDPEPFEDYYEDCPEIDGELVVCPAFNDLSGGTWVNVEGQTFLSPFLPNALEEGDAYLLDGTRLGPYDRV